MKAPTAAAVLATARAQLARGPYERPPGSNRTYFGAHYGMDGVAWCCISLWCVFDWTPGGRELLVKTGLVEVLRAWFDNHGRTGAAPRPGAVVFLNFGAAPVGKAHHVGLVEAVHADGTITTLEGNTGGRGIGERGDGYYRRTRSPASVVSYGYPAYAPAGRRARTPRPLPGAGDAVAARPAATIHGAVGLGDRGADVQVVQRAVGVADDGYFGQVTLVAVIAAQERAGVPGDGVVGPITAAALGLVWAR